MNYFKELEKLGHDLFDHTDYSFRMNIFADCSNGYITEPLSSSDKKQVVVGAKDLFKDMLIGKKDARKFTTSLVCLFHEYTHFEQFEDIRSGFADSDIAHSFMARQENDLLYLRNYKNMVHEIDAEHQGVMRAYAYIKDNHPELDADKCIMDHIRYKQSIGDTRYIGRTFDNSEGRIHFDLSECNNISEVDNMFKSIRNNINKSDIDCVSMMRIYNSADRSKSDELMFDMFDKDPKSIDILKCLPGSEEQLKFISSYYADKYPDRSKYFKNYHSASYQEYLQAYDRVMQSDKFASITKRGEMMMSLLPAAKPVVDISRSDICGYSEEVSFAASFDDIADDNEFHGKDL